MALNISHIWYWLSMMTILTSKVTYKMSKLAFKMIVIIEICITASILIELCTEKKFLSSEKIKTLKWFLTLRFFAL